MSSRGPNGGRELTQFDKLAIAICWFGAAVLIGLHVLLVPEMEYVYTDLDELIPGFTKIVKSPGYAVSMALLMVFLAYQGSRMRRLYDSRSASTVLFFGLMVSIAANGLFIWGMYAPAGRSFQMLGS
ncbi:MAG: hypothetical protein MUE69_20880 [Myxococcota bacterium]|jgi:hypothetical protein|nr:hypothetical protein [Myxococcota bacterium]